MRKFYLTMVVLFTGMISNAQTVAMDFTQDDCLGYSHHLFEELDQNNVVIIEFFMTNCSPCINAGNALTPVYNQLLLDYPGHVSWYHFAFNNSYTCATVQDWVDSNGFPSTPFTQGAAMVAYYGGFGMPTIVVVGGANHDVLFSEVGFSTGDQLLVKSAVEDFFGAFPISVAEVANVSLSMSTVYKSSSDEVMLNFTGVNGKAEITVYAVDGRLAIQNSNYGVVSTGTIVNLSTAGLPVGTYVINARSGEEQISGRFTIIR